MNTRLNGETTFDSVVQGLGRAKRYALVQFYIVRDDGLGRRVKQAMRHCTCTSPGSLREASFMKRLAVSVARLTSPLL